MHHKHLTNLLKFSNFFRLNDRLKSSSDTLAFPLYIRMRQIQCCLCDQKQGRRQEGTSLLCQVLVRTLSYLLSSSPPAPLLLTISESTEDDFWNSAGFLNAGLVSHIWVLKKYKLTTTTKMTGETPEVRFDKRKPREDRKNHRYHGYCRYYVFNRQHGYQ